MLSWAALNCAHSQGRLPWLLHQGGKAGWGDWATPLPPVQLTPQHTACEGVDFMRNSILSEVSAPGSGGLHSLVSPGP